MGLFLDPLFTVLAARATMFSRFNSQQRPYKYDVEANQIGVNFLGMPKNFPEPATQY
jgi:hypothetical protein